MAGLRVVPGEGPCRARLMLIGEAPGRTEVKIGRPFVGRAGRFLGRALTKAGIERKKVYITNVVKVRPTRVLKGKTRDRKPTPAEIAKWLPKLNSEIRRVRPRVIVLLGGTAVDALVGKIAIQKVRGKKIRKDGAVLVPTFHPYAAMRNRRYRALFERDLEKAQRYLS